MDQSEPETLSQSHYPSNSHQHPQAELDDPKVSPPLTPPYWSHRRYESYLSVENTNPPPITLEDHTEGTCEQNSPLWAKGVSIDDYVLITGNVPNIGNFVVWNCKIDMLDVSLILIE